MQKRNHMYTVPMIETFDLLEKRLLEANLNIDSTSLKSVLNHTKDTAVCIGCGGSLIVANFLSKILEERGVFSICRNSRDILYSKNNARNLFAYSYSGNTYGIHAALDCFPGNKYLLTCNSNQKDAIILGYPNMEKEKSFVSLSSTLIPIGEFLKYQDNISAIDFSKKIQDYFQDTNDWVETLSSLNFTYDNYKIFEIMTGYDTEVASFFLESTLIEAGLGIPIIHDKYSYCHGRSTIHYQDRYKHHLIYLVNKKTELDTFLLEIFSNINSFPITLIDVSKSNSSSLERQYELLIKAIFLCKKIAEDKKKDLSQVEYDRNIVSKVYRYKGEM